MKTNKKTLVLSALAALAFGAGAVGSTFALFTSTDETNVTVTTGKVDVKMEASLTHVYSPTSISSDGSITKDENAATYVEGEKSGSFSNGGTVSLAENTLALNNVTPGDKAKFDVKVTNSSTVNIKYRFVYKLNEDTTEAKEFASALKVTSKIGDTSKDMTGILEYRTAYKTKAANDAEQEETLHFEIELPTTATIQGATCSFKIAVEAVQGNAEVDDNEFVSKYSKVASSSELTAALSDVTSSEGASIDLTEDVKLDDKLAISGKGKEVTLDLNDKAITGTVTSAGQPLLSVSGGSTLNVKGGTIEGTTAESNSGSSSLVNVNDNSVMNLEDVTLSAKSDGAALSMMGDNAEVNISGGEIKTTSYDGFGIATNGSETKNGKITIEDTKINSNSYALYLPGDADVELINCEVVGWTVITGGKTKINGGTYSTNLLNYYNICEAYKDTDKNNLKNYTYASKTSDEKYYFGLDGAYTYYANSNGACGCLFDTITIVENRQGNYAFESFEMADAKIGIIGRKTTSVKNDIIFGVRYVNGSDNTKYESENVTITNCSKENSGIDYIYSASFFKDLAN